VTWSTPVWRSGSKRLPATLPVSKRVNSSKPDADDATLIERVELASEGSPEGKGPIRSRGLKCECQLRKVSDHTQHDCRV
jgi:hypothetical protein